MDDIVKSVALATDTLPLTADNAGLDALYDRHWTELCHYIKKHYGVGPPDPEDVAQEAFLKFAGIADRDSIDNPRAYLFRMAHNVLMDEHRRLAVRRVNALDNEASSDDRTPERVLLAQERMEILTRSLNAMPEARRRSFLLNRLQGLSCAAIARMTGYSESAIKKHIEIALTELEAAVTKAERTGPRDAI